MEYNKILKKTIKESGLLNFIDSNYKKIKDVDAILYDYRNNKYMDTEEMVYINRNIYLTFEDDSIMVLFYGATYRREEVFYVIKVDEIDIDNPEIVLLEIDEHDNTELHQLFEKYAEEYEGDSNQVTMQNVYEDIYDALYLSFAPSLKINDNEKITKFLRKEINELNEKTNIKTVVNSVVDFESLFKIDENEKLVRTHLFGF